MGAALLVLCANYSVHLFGSLRSLHPGAAILMNLSTYFLVYWLFSAALTVLLDRFYVTRRRFLRHLACWGAFTALAAAVLIVVPPGGRAAGRAGVPGLVAPGLRASAGPQAHPHLPPGRPPVRRHAFRAHRRLHPVDVRVHLVGGHLRG